MLDFVAEALKRFATGTYAIWYPIIPRPEAHDLPRRLKTLATKAGKPWLHATLTVKSSKILTDATGATHRPGLPASGMFLINPPYTLKAAARAGPAADGEAPRAGPPRRLLARQRRLSRSGLQRRRRGGTSRLRRGAAFLRRLRGRGLRRRRIDRGGSIAVSPQRVVFLSTIDSATCLIPIPSMPSASAAARLRSMMRPGRVGPAVVDAHQHFAPVDQAAHADAGVEGQRLVGGGHRRHVEALAVGGLALVELDAVPGGAAALEDLARPCVARHAVVGVVAVPDTARS